MDLLISFAYAQSIDGRLREFPHGLGLLVPKSFDTKIAATTGRNYHSHSPPSQKNKPTKSFDVKYDRRLGEILFPVVGTSCPLRSGEWLAIELEGRAGSFHCRVSDTSGFPSVRVGPHINCTTTDGTTDDIVSSPTAVDVDSVTSAVWLPASVEKYDLNFDEVNDAESKRGIITNLIRCLPSVAAMKVYLMSQRSPDLAKWTDKISPAALGVLRWIIASNRACIMQVYDMGGDGKPIPKEDRVFGMKDWMQFRFAMGAPDKERRFIKSVRETARRLALQKPPTLFAFHGSALSNWHSIIRDGLNYDEILSGRAFGNGVYHSLHLSTSLGYSGGGGPCYAGWPNSVLRIEIAIALNEIVNAPAEFTSRDPHLVVQHVDWIQTRYLFVKCVGDSFTHFEEEKPSSARPQDPVLIPYSSAGIKLIIPACSSAPIGKRRVSIVKSSKQTKKVKGEGMSTDPMIIDGEDEVRFGDDGLSDTTDPEDLEVLFDEETTTLDPPMNTIPHTDFVPGELDHDKLPKLPMPEFANSTTTRRLQKDFQSLLKVQKSTPLHEIGWYIDPDKFDCPYQWIIELHSFHTFEDKGKKLPLVDDMKKAGIKSIILELRFPGSYPMSPPFVRVIRLVVGDQRREYCIADQNRPRFLSFMQGGGGHITAGGALCMELLTKYIPNYLVFRGD